MAKVDKTIEVGVPVRTAYNQWTQFEEFPRFMEGIQEVRQLDDERLYWSAEFGGEHREWFARITRQIPDEVIAWESEGGAGASGTVIFRPVGIDTTELEVHMDYETDGLKEKLGDVTGYVSRQVSGDLDRFKEFIETRGVESGAWRGEIVEGQVGPAGSAPDRLDHMDRTDRDRYRGAAH